MFTLIYLLSILICLIGWHWQYKNSHEVMGNMAKISAAFLSLIPGLNTIIALAFLSEFVLRW